MAMEIDYDYGKDELVQEAKDWLKFIPSSRIEFKKGKNKLNLFYDYKRIPHTLISLEWVKHGNIDYIEVLSFNTKQDPDDFTPDSNDLMEFDNDEIAAIISLAKANAKQFAI